METGANLELKERPEPSPGVSILARVGGVGVEVEDGPGAPASARSTGLRSSLRSGLRTGLARPRPSHVDILGVKISSVDMQSASTYVEQLIASRGKGYVCVTGVHGIMEAQKDPTLHAILNRAFLAVPDGMPTVWVGQAYGHRSMRRVYGPDLMLELCERSVARGFRHFLYGGNPGVAQALKANLLTRFPGLEIVGTCTPPFRPLNTEEERQLIEEVARTRPDILWVGLSTPKQERFMDAMLERLETSVMIGVGAAFDIHTGNIKDAPGWMKQCGLQWLHRLGQEPRRLGRRYLVNNPRFVVGIAGQLLRDAASGRMRGMRRIRTMREDVRS
jgi:N-acetylglucosaminyldiphosphoundecaprenol N-acetyl-beta-D-mannosaminyltransferase